MCGRLNVIDDPFVRALMAALGLPVYPKDRLNIAPGAAAQIVVRTPKETELVDAVWSLLIEPKPKGKGYRPHPKWHTFNAQSTRLKSSRLWSAPYKAQRAIIPASGFHEWKDGQCFNVQTVDAPMALAGLYKTWCFDDRSVVSFTVITLPPQKAFRHIHAKSFPLMLLPDEYDKWLDPALTQTGALDYLLKTGIRQNIIVSPILDPHNLEAVDEPELISASPGS